MAIDIEPAKPAVGQSAAATARRSPWMGQNVFTAIVGGVLGLRCSDTSSGTRSGSATRTLRAAARTTWRSSSG